MPKCIDLFIDTNKYARVHSVRLKFEENGKVWYEEFGQVIRSDSVRQLIAKYGIKEFNKILNSQLEIGMTEEEAALIGGEPDIVARSGSWIYNIDDSVDIFKCGRYEGYVKD